MLSPYNNNIYNYIYNLVIHNLVFKIDYILNKTVIRNQSRENQGKASQILWGL